MSAASRLHAGPPARAGASLGEAAAVLVLVHGRGATPESILPLGDELLSAASPRLDDPRSAARVSLIAPRADGGSWYPYAFTAPHAANEPHLSAALERLRETAEELAAAGVPDERIVWVGFSQGACLMLEHVARTARPGRLWGAVGGLSGGLIGPPGTTWDHAPDGSLEGTPLFLGCSDQDPHIPLERVRESARVFERLGAAVDQRIYPGMPHTVVRDEIDALAEPIARAVSGTDLASS